MSSRPNSAFTGLGLVVAVIFWGGNNAGLRFLARDWPPGWTASIRFLIAGAALLSVLKWTRWLGELKTLSPSESRALWWRGGVLLAGFMFLCNVTFRILPASHFALHMAAGPVWALLLERGFTRGWALVRQLAAIALAFTGVGVLLWPSLHQGQAALLGECLGLIGSLGWTIYSRQSRHLAQTIPPVEVTARSMWRAGWLLLPVGLLELRTHPVHFTPINLAVMVYSALFGAAVAYALWNHALTVWPSSRVFLFSNLIPVTTSLMAHWFLDEPLTSSFASAMVLIVSGVLLGVVDFGRLAGRWWTPED